MNHEEAIKRLEALANPKNVEGMARFGIRPKTKVLGVPIPEIRKIAKIIKKDHALALALFDSKIHEARILAGYIADPQKITEKQFERWVKTFDSWDVVDQVCSSCLDKTSFVYKKIFELSKRKEEFVKRTAFTLMAVLASHDKKAPNKKFLKFFPIIKRASTDERNFVKKAVNWALRGTGKRNSKLNKEAIKLAKEIHPVIRPGVPLDNGAKAAKWIAQDAIRELTSQAVQKRFKNK